MHAHKIAHRDIKPDNIMKMSNTEYMISDFGIGINLTVRAEYFVTEDGGSPYDYQKGEFDFAGTVAYMDPILRAEFVHY